MEYSQMMKVSYFPGCTLKTKAKALDISARRSAEALGITFEELPEWQCCGGVFTTATDEVATKLAAVRALASAGKKGQVLVSVCAACHNVLKQTNEAMKNDGAFAAKVNAYLPPEERYDGSTRVLHYLELLRDEVGFDAIREKAGNTLAGKKIGAYYGCLLLRPGRVMTTDDPENPKLLEDFIKALGAEPVIYPYRNECCGGYTVLENGGKGAAEKSGEILRSAGTAGAEMLVTACPLCRYNLEKHSDRLPVLYFTELLAKALGVDGAEAPAGVL